jgi:putative ABC transport system permease protein
MAFSNLWRRKLRTTLTILAVVIGATLVALMVSLGTGLKGFVVDQFGLMVPQNVVNVSTTERLFATQGGPPHEITSREVEIPRPFTGEDVARIRAIEGVERVDYGMSVPAIYVSPEDSDKQYSVFAHAVPDYEAQMRELVAGAHFAEDTTGESLIAYDYLGTFGWPDAEAALGREVTIAVGKQDPYNLETREFTFTVVGVIQKTMNATQILVPTGDAQEMARYYQDNAKLYTEEQPGFFLQVKAVDEALVGQVAEDISALGFNTITPTEILDEINSVFGIIQIGLSAFGIIALVVATIGIINTMIMAIYERTREIGVMKAVGATRGTIRLLFVVEGGALGFLGGVIGVGLGILLGQLLNLIGSRTFLSDFPTLNMSVFSPGLVFGVIALTTGISLLAALYPANRAARLDPVEALRYE